MSCLKLLGCCKEDGFLVSMMEGASTARGSSRNPTVISVGQFSRAVSDGKLSLGTSMIAEQCSFPMATCRLCNHVAMPPLSPTHVVFFVFLCSGTQATK